MDSNFKSSFIPRNNVVVGEKIQKSKMGFLGALASFIFILALLSLGGIFAYKKITENAISNQELQLASLEAALDKASINNLLNFDKKVQSLKEIIESHVALSAYFNMLEENTIANVQFLDLKYSAPKNSPILVEMKGKTTSYAAVAEQERILDKNINVQGSSFEGMSLDQNSGGVFFTLKAKFRPETVNFKNFVIKNTSLSPTTSDLVQPVENASTTATSTKKNP